MKELQARGHKIGRDFMRSALIDSGLKAIQPRSFVPRTTDSRHRLGFNPNLLLDQSALTGANQVWVSDIRYIMLSSGQWAYLVTWMDLCRAAGAVATYCRLAVGYQHGRRAGDYGFWPGYSAPITYAGFDRSLRPGGDNMPVKHLVDY